MQYIRRGNRRPHRKKKKKKKKEEEEEEEKKPYFYLSSYMNRVENGSEHFLIHKLIKKEWVF
jgi:hypothetical protein